MNKELIVSPVSAFSSDRHQAARVLEVQHAHTGTMHSGLVTGMQIELLRLIRDHALVTFSVGGILTALFADSEVSDWMATLHLGTEGMEFVSHPKSAFTQAVPALFPEGHRLGCWTDLPSPVRQAINWLVAGEGVVEDYSAAGCQVNPQATAVIGSRVKERLQEWLDSRLEDYASEPLRPTWSSDAGNSRTLVRDCAGILTVDIRDYFPAQWSVLEGLTPPFHRCGVSIHWHRFDQRWASRPLYTRL